MMKRILPTLIFTMFIAFIAGQPSLHSNEMLPYGSVMVETSVLNIPIIDTTIQGEGVTWDFSGIIDNTADDDLVVTITDPAETPYFGNFANANYTYKEEINGATNYRYFNLTDTKMERVGSYVSAVNVYTDPQIEYVFPMEMGSSSYDTWNSTSSSNGGVYTLNCIGTGTLITPGGTFNALMVKAFVQDSFLDVDVYFWYDSDNGSILLTYILGDGFWVADAATYLSNLTVGVVETNIIADVTYNNPVSDVFNLSFQALNSGTYSYSVINSFGQLVYQKSSQVNLGDRESLEIDFNNFSRGIYLFMIKTDGMDNVTKTIKVVKN